MTRLFHWCPQGCVTQSRASGHACDNKCPYMGLLDELTPGPIGQKDEFQDSGENPVQTSQCVFLKQVIKVTGSCVDKLSIYK